MDHSSMAKHQLAPQVKPIASLEVHKNSVECCQFHPNSASTLVSGSFDHTFAVWDLNSNKLSKQVEAHP